MSIDLTAMEVDVDINLSNLAKLVEINFAYCSIVKWIAIAAAVGYIETIADDAEFFGLVAYDK